MAQDLTTIFNNAARNIAMRASSDWTMSAGSGDPDPGGTWEDGVWKPSKKKSPWEKLKEAYKKTSTEASKGTFYKTYLDTLNMLQKSKKTLPGKVGIGMESPRVYGGKAPGRSQVATDRYSEKLGEVTARMRRFATAKYYAGIGGYGKS